MPLEFSEIIWFVANPEESAAHYAETMGWQEVERYEDSWILMSTPGNGKIGFMKRIAQEGKPWPAQTVAFKSSSIEEDVAELQSRGFKVTNVTKAMDMWHASHEDQHGNKLLIWQEPR